METAKPKKIPEDKNSSTHPVSERLTESEIEQLKQETADANAYFQSQFKGLRVR
jgi:hypothetical protein